MLHKVISSIDDEQINVYYTDEDTVILFDSNAFENQRSLIAPIKRHV
jgi:hypothetical protein